MAKPKTISILDAPKKLGISKGSISAHKAIATRNDKVVVGFFKDTDGKIKPITKSLRSLNRKKVIKKPRKVKPVSPKM